MDPAAVRFDAPSAERETQAGSIRASLLELAEQIVGTPAGEAAFVLDLDEHALGTGGRL